MRVKNVKAPPPSPAKVAWHNLPMLPYHTKIIYYMHPSSWIERKEKCALCMWYNYVCFERSLKLEPEQGGETYQCCPSIAVRTLSFGGVA